MNKIHNKLTLSSLAILAILALGVLTMPSSAKADSNSAGYVNAYNRSGMTDGGVNSYSASSTVSKPKAASTTSTTSTASASKPAVKSSSLAANAVSAQTGSMVSGILGWILIAILILLIVVVARKLIGADKKYHSTPMKHA